MSPNAKELFNSINLQRLWFLSTSTTCECAYFQYPKAPDFWLGSPSLPLHNSCFSQSQPNLANEADIISQSNLPNCTHKTQKCEDKLRDCKTDECLNSYCLSLSFGLSFCYLSFHRKWGEQWQASYLKEKEWGLVGWFPHSCSVF